MAAQHNLSITHVFEYKKMHGECLKIRGFNSWEVVQVHYQIMM